MSSRFLALLGVIFLIACGAPPAAKNPDAVDIVGAKGIPAVRAPEPEGEGGSEPSIAVPVSEEDAQLGERSAPVTMVVFTDFQCPYCGRHSATTEALRGEFGDSLRIVVKNNPLSFHTHARLAAEIAQGLWATHGADAYWAFYNRAFSSQAKISPETLKDWAVLAGMSESELEAGLERHTWAAKVDRDIALAKSLDANGTPASFINGVFVSGAQTFEKLKSVVSEELAAAKALESQGTPKRKIYGLRVAENIKAANERKRQTPDDDDEVEDTTTAFKVPVGTSPVRGKSSALVTIVVFSDFQCPFCKKVEPTLDQIRKTYGDKVRIVWKDEPLPFHPRAKPAAHLARAARAQKGDAGFWDMHDRLFASQPKLEDPDLEQLAKDAGLDVKKAMAAVSTEAFSKSISADMALGDDVQANGTPHLFVNGRRLVGAMPFEKFQPVIDQEIKKADALVASGTAATAVYDALQKTAKGPPDPERKTVTVSGSAPFRGPSNAPVTIVEWADFQCPFCTRVEPTLDKLLVEYAGKVKIVWRNKPLPMHVDAPLAAQAAREAFIQKGNDGFQKYRALLFKNQQALKRADLEGYATTVGLDLGKFKKALDAETHKAAIEAESKAADDAGISGTPAFTVGPYFVNGAQPIEKFKKLVELALNPPPSATPASTASLKINDTKVGTGQEAHVGDTLEVHYTGKLTDGTEFDSSRPRGQAFSFKLGEGRVIKGWDQGLVGMRVGGKRTITIAPSLGYGDAGSPPKIPAKATLVFDVELLGIK